jgi:O-acetyl-ADP-ribose deacetylase (regulator of RNase III)
MIPWFILVHPGGRPSARNTLVHSPTGFGWSSTRECGERWSTVSFDHWDNSNQTVEENGVRFGRTILRAQFGGWATSHLDLLVLPGNQRGLTGVNLTGGGRIDGGLDVERELMARAPLTLGTAAATGAGTLATGGIHGIVHAIVAEQLGDPPRESSLRQAIAAAMRELDRVRARRVGVLPFGSGSMLARVGRTESLPIMIEEIVGYFRRTSSRVELVTILCNSSSEAQEVSGLIDRIRRDLWGTRV